MNQKQAEGAKYQVRNASGKLLAAAGTFGGIDAFLDRFADGTPNADYETVEKKKDECGNNVYVVREL